MRIEQMINETLSNSVAKIHIDNKYNHIKKYDNGIAIVYHYNKILDDEVTVIALINIIDDYYHIIQKEILSKEILKQIEKDLKTKKVNFAATNCGSKNVILDKENDTLIENIY